MSDASHQTSMRRQQGNAFEILLSQNLLLANSAEPQKQVALVSQAAMRCDFDEDTKVEGKPLQSLIHALSTLNTSIMFASKWVYEDREVRSIKWDRRILSDPNFYAMYIGPWDDAFECLGRAKAEAGDKWEKDAQLTFTMRTKYLTPLGFDFLRSAFYSWAIPETQNIHRYVSFKIGGTNALAAMSDSGSGGLKIKE